MACSHEGFFHDFVSQSRRQDWNTEDPVLKTIVNAKLFVYQAAAQMEFEGLMSLETDGKKRLILEALTLLIANAEACFTSLWRKMKACKDLFSSLLSGIAKVAVAEGGQPLRMLLIRLKALVLAVCAEVILFCHNLYEQHSLLYFGVF